MKKYIIIIFIMVLILSIVVVSVIKNSKKRFKSFEIYPEIGSIAIEFKVTGSVEPRNQIEIKPQISGRIEEILVTEGQNVKKGAVIVWMSSTDRAALLDSVRSKGVEELKKWEDVYNPTPIIAPIDGFIIARLKEPGQTVTQNDVILVMADELIIEANVDETDLRYIRLGQKLKIFLDAYPDKEFYGKIEHIAYKSQTINNVTVYKIKILPLNAPKDFRAGMTATIKVISQKKENVLLLPTNAIIKKDNKKMVIIRSEGPRPEIREVQTGIDNGKKVEIISGISENDTVLIHVSEKKAGQMMGPPSLFGK